MAAISDYLETQILNHIFRESNFSKPTNVSIALTSDVAKDNQSGATIPEIPASVSVGQSSFLTNYNRQSLENQERIRNNMITNLPDYSNHPEAELLHKKIYF